MGLEDDIFELKFTSRRLSKLSSKSSREQEKLESQLKSALAKQDLERARIYAESAIRKKNESVNYLRMASKLDAVVSNLKLSSTMNNLSKTMTSVVKSLGKAMDNGELEKVTEIMDKFEKQSEDLDVRSSVMESTMSQTTTTLGSLEEVESLMRQVAEENGLDVSARLANVPNNEPIDNRESVGRVDREEDQLSRRLAALRD